MPLVLCAVAVAGFDSHMNLLSVAKRSGLLLIQVSATTLRSLRPRPDKFFWLDLGLAHALLPPHHHAPVS